MLHMIRHTIAIASLVAVHTVMAFPTGLPQPSGARQNTGCTPLVGFSPSHGAMDLVIKLIDSTTQGQEIDISAYEFASRRIAAALHTALNRGVTLKLAVDAGVNVGKRYSRAYEFLNTPGAEVRYEDRWPIFHEKVVLVPALNALEEGSMNFTDAGDTKNHENANLFPNCQAVVEQYEANFDDIWRQGTPLQ